MASNTFSSNKTNTVGKAVRIKDSYIESSISPESGEFSLQIKKGGETTPVNVNKIVKEEVYRKINEKLGFY